MGPGGKAHLKQASCPLQHLVRSAEFEVAILHMISVVSLGGRMKDQDTYMTDFHGGTKVRM